MDIVDNNQKVFKAKMWKLTSKSPNSVKFLSNMIKLSLEINLFLLYLIFGSYFRLKIGNFRPIASAIDVWVRDPPAVSAPPACGA